MLLMLPGVISFRYFRVLWPFLGKWHFRHKQQVAAAATCCRQLLPGFQFSRRSINSDFCDWASRIHFVGCLQEERQETMECSLVDGVAFPQMQTEEAFLLYTEAHNPCWCECTTLWVLRASQDDGRPVCQCEGKAEAVPQKFTLVILKRAQGGMVVGVKLVITVRPPWFVL